MDKNKSMINGKYKTMKKLYRVGDFHEHHLLDTAFLWIDCLQQ